RCSAGFFSHVPVSTPLSPLSLHDALPILHRDRVVELLARLEGRGGRGGSEQQIHAAIEDVAEILGDERAHLLGLAVIRVIVARRDRKSTRLNSSHVSISYAVFCLKKKITK